MPGEEERECLGAYLDRHNISLNAVSDRPRRSGGREDRPRPSGRVLTMPSNSASSYR